MPTPRNFVALQPGGAVAIAPAVKSYLQGLGDLLSFAAPLPRFGALRASEIERAGFERTGNAMREAMKRCSERHSA